MESNKLIHLLNRVNGIIEKYQAIAEKTGENFNIFEVLGLTTNEVRTHSSFLAELLNPKGSHGQGSVFLDLFTKQLNIEFSNDCVSVEIEKFIGRTNENYTEGGFIDILISNSTQVIIIENKIYAPDQENQLVRYNNYGKALNKKIYLFYLTLDGKMANDYSSGALKESEDYKCISYKCNIINWLENAKKEVALIPIVRETIVQYIHLIKSLTNQTKNNKMSEEIINEILASNNIESAIAITNNIINLKLKIMVKFNDDLFKKFEENKLKIDDKEECHLINENVIKFSKVGSEYYIQFIFDKNFEYLWFGITDSNDIWIKDSNGKDWNYLKEWENFSWTDIYSTNEELLQNILEKKDQLFQEIELLNKKDV